MVDALDTDKIGSWKDHDPRMRTTHFILDGQPYSGATHPMRSAHGLIHYSGVRHTAESKRLTFSLRPVIIPEDFAFLDREERVPRDALDGMFERQPMEQDIYNTTGELVAVRTVMRERQSPFNGARDKPRSDSNIVTTRLFTTRQQQVIDRMSGISAASAPSTSEPPPEPPSTSTTTLPASPSSAQMEEPQPATPQPSQFSPFDMLRMAAMYLRPEPRLLEFSPPPGMPPVTVETHPLRAPTSSPSASGSGLVTRELFTVPMPVSTPGGKKATVQSEITDTFKPTKLKTPPSALGKAPK